MAYKDSREEAIDEVERLREELENLQLMLGIALMYMEQWLSSGEVPVFDYPGPDGSRGLAKHLVAVGCCNYNKLTPSPEWVERMTAEATQ